MTLLHGMTLKFGVIHEDRHHSQHALYQIRLGMNVQDSLTTDLMTRMLPLILLLFVLIETNPVGILV